MQARTLVLLILNMSCFVGINEYDTVMKLHFLLTQQEPKLSLNKSTDH